MIHRVCSPDDPRLAAYRHVADPGWLRSHGLFVAEGRLVVERLLSLTGYEIASIVVTPAALAALGPRVADSNTDVYVCGRAMLCGITGFNFHRGCLALVVRPAPTLLDRFSGARRLLGLEGVGNPDNVGGLFRAAAAFGVEGVLLDLATGDPLYRKAIRTSMGATLRLPFVRAAAWLDTLRVLQGQGLRVVGLTPEPGAAPIEAARRELSDERLILLLGAEGPGLGPDTLALSDVRLRIPIETSVDSLNVVVAAGIALHALCEIA
jgi:tRNA G18 (ribose-2'-O)-methylase SpoU